RIHLAVEKLNDPAKLRGDLIGDENHADSASLKIHLDPLPELLRTDPFIEKGSQFLRRIGFSLLTPLLKLGTDRLDRPVDNRVGGVVEHLADDFAADAGVTAPLDLDQGRDGVLVEEQVVQRPAVAALLLGRHSHLPGDQQPAPRGGTVHLVPGQEVRVSGEEFLEYIFTVVGLLLHLHEFATSLDEKDTAVHCPPLRVLRTGFPRRCCGGCRNQRGQQGCWRKLLLYWLSVK